MKQLQLMDKAAASISDSDLVDALIHGYATFTVSSPAYLMTISGSSEQHWALMPLHAVCSTVRPASFLYGTGGGYGSPNPICFPL